jgi:hypothetical protein
MSTFLHSIMTALFLLALVITPSSSGQGKSAATGQEIKWEQQCVDCPKYIAEPSEHALQLDNAGMPHIAYGGDHLYYAWYDGSKWNRETVDGANGVGYGANLALDPQGHAHIVYTDIGKGELRYAVQLDTGWDIQVLESDPDGAILSFSLALTQEGSPRIAYDDPGGEGLVYAWQSPEGWQSEIVDTGGAGTISLALDGNGLPNIAYHTWDGLKFASFDGDSWDNSIILLTNSMLLENGISLATTSDGNAYIAFYGGDEQGSALRVAILENGSWSFQSADHFENSGEGISLELNNIGEPNIAYFTDVSTETSTEIVLKYASFQQGVWNVVPLYASVTGKSFPSLAIGADGLPRIAYLSDGDLIYGHQIGETWSSEVVDVGGDAGTMSSMKVDQAGHIHMAYLHEGLKYAFFNGSQWTLEGVDAARIVSTKPSLALDSSGNAHIAYVDDATGYLRFASRLEGNWTSEEIPLFYPYYPYVTYSDPCLVFDQSDQPHIVAVQNEFTFKEYIRKSDGWHQIYIPETLNRPEQLTLAIDAENNRHLAYADWSAGMVGYMSANGEDWTNATVIDKGMVYYLSPSLAVAEDGTVIVAYTDQARQLKIAEKPVDGIWVSNVIEDAGVAYGNVSLAIDQKGYLHVVYYDPDMQALNYIAWDGVEWQTSIVDLFACADYGDNLAIDPVGRVVIAYHDYFNKDLKLARSSPAFSLSLPIVLR